jgi:phospholipid/cholesterol/gamma-HCH transport system ATP-binding protein
MDPVIELQNVTLGFDSDIVLKDVNLKVMPGDVLVLIGPSGSGKTILLKTMAGVYSPLAGKVFCEGENLETMSRSKRQQLAQHLGMQFQKSALFDSLTVYENVAFPLREQGHYSEAKIQQRVAECLEAVNLTSSAKLFPHEISGGMRQRLGIARAIAMKPDIVLYDDPTAGLDPIHADKIVELILDLKQRHNSTVVIVTHSMDVAYRLNGTIALVADQAVLVTGNREATEKHPDPRVQQFIHGRLTGPLTSDSGE